MSQEQESATYKVKLVHDAHVQAIKDQHEDPLANNPYVVAPRPVDSYTQDHVEYTHRVLEAMTMERDQLLFRLRALDNNINQAHTYLASLTPPPDAA